MEDSKHIPAVEDIMTPMPLEVINISDDVYIASKLMKEKQISSIIVTDEEKHPIGIITERDIVRRVVCNKKIASNTSVESIMSKPLVTVESKANIDEAVAIMIKNKIRRLPIVKDGHLYGLITTTDLIRYMFQKYVTDKEILKSLLRYKKYWEE
ncbi:MAG TPA: CBS domain-containing protein [Nitrososphaeraceae archaeon]|nr:CBS domain-containing protein [Nitrososphaeraceae archaeon]